MGAYREQTRRGEGRSEEGAAARPAVAAGNEAESSGRDVVGTEGQTNVLFSFS